MLLQEKKKKKYLFEEGKIRCYLEEITNRQEKMCLGREKIGREEKKINKYMNMKIQTFGEGKLKFYGGKYQKKENNRVGNSNLGKIIEFEVENY